MINAHHILTPVSVSLDGIDVDRQLIKRMNHVTWRVSFSKQKHKSLIATCEGIHNLFRQ